MGLRLLLPWLAAGSLLGCGTAPTASEAVIVDAVVNPGVIRPGDPMTVTLTVVNPTADSLTLVSPHSCFVLPEVWADDVRLAWEGTGLGCLTVVTYHGIGAGKSLEMQWTLTARLQEQQAPWDYVIPAAPGIYRVVLDMEVPLPDIEREFEVVN